MIVARHGELAIHGIAMRPSSPTGLGTIGRRLMVLLPGNPVSSLCAYDFFAGRAIRGLGGRPLAWPYRMIRARLARKISSPVGRLDYARVKIVDRVVEPLSVTGASVLSSTTRADGFVIVAVFAPEPGNGVGDPVKVAKDSLPADTSAPAVQAEAVALVAFEQNRRRPPKILMTVCQSLSI
jgi:molybdopterin molybdotransferase